MADNKELSHEYKKVYEEFYLLLRTCHALSREFANIPSPTSAHYYASLIFTKLCVSGFTVLKICPSPKDIGNDRHWDSASVATLTRGIVETYIMFFYLCVEECDPEEWQARWRLLNLHDHMSRHRMFTSLGEATGNYDSAKKFEMHADEVRGDLLKTQYFQSLSERLQKHYLRGVEPFFKSQDEIIVASGGNVWEFRYMYRFLSNHTHSYPMGFYRMVESDRGRGVETASEIAYTANALSWALEYLESAKDGFYKIWTPHAELVKERKSP